ncbi:MAG TPA: ABC transporter permease [Thermoanaerobaculia bacterium]|nr:ABC transporter permease [Thermoanaerobaculia bacterium]
MFRDERGQRRRPFWYLRRRPETVAAEVDEELESHLAMRVEELRAKGLSEAEARREALRRFGDFDAVRASCRNLDDGKENRVQRRLWLEDLRHDLRICLRGLARAPLVSLTIMATVGLGIGATTAIATAIHAVLLRPLPYANPEELVRIYTDSPPNKFRFSVADFQALETQQTQFVRVAGYTERSVAWSDGATAEKLRARSVSWRYFGLLGLPPALGRDFTEADGKPGAPRTALVSHRFWTERLGGAADAVGRTVRFDGVPYTVVGVLPPRLGPLEHGVEAFTAAQWAPPPRKGPFFIVTLGRLKPGAARPAAEELRAINRRIFPLWQSSYADRRATWSMNDLKTEIVGEAKTPAGLALGAVALVWLIACANASNLLVARVVNRRRELAVRSALGATRERVVRHLLAESALLAIGAAVLGAALAGIGTRLLRSLGETYTPRAAEIALGGGSIVLLVVLAAASALLFGLAPAVHGTGGAPAAEALQGSGRTATGGVAARRLRRVLVGTQFAVATPLLVVAGLLLASLHRLQRVDVGFDPRHVIGGSIYLPEAPYPDAGKVAAFWDELERRVAALPGVAAVAFADGRPPDDVGNFNNFDLEDFPTRPGESEPVTPWVQVSPEYFRLLGVPLLEGRTFDERDGGTGSIEEAVVDRAFARRFFPNGSAVGKRFHEGGCRECPWTRVVGVVGNVKYAGLAQPDAGSVYWPMPGRATTPNPDSMVRFRYLLVRTKSDPASLAPAIGRVLHDLDPGIPIANVATQEDLLATSVQATRSLSLLVGGLAIAALLLSVIGIYGVMAYFVEQHAREVGIRLALGGSRRAILGLIVGQGMRVAAAGVAFGLGAAALATRLIASLLFGIGAADAPTFAGVGAVLALAALLACLIPARRAASVAPASVLRGD